MLDPHFLPATAPPATRSDVFGPMRGGERGLWQGRCAVAEYAFDEAGSLPRWALPETTEILVTDQRIVYAYTRADSPEGLAVTSGELRWLWPQHLRVQPGARAAGHAAAQIQLVCAATDGSFPALVFAGGELDTVGDVDKLANLIRHAIARFRVDNAAQLGLSMPQSRMLSRLLIGPEFSNFQGGEGQTVTLLGALAVHRPADTEPEPAGHPQPAEPQYADLTHAEPQYAEPQYVEPQYAEPQYAEPQRIQPEYVEPEHADLEYAEPAYAEPAYADLEYAEPHYTDLTHTQPHYADLEYAQPQYAGALMNEPAPGAPLNEPGLGALLNEPGPAPYHAPIGGPDADSLLLAAMHADLPQPHAHPAPAEVSPPYPAYTQHHGSDHAEPYPVSTGGTTVRLPGFRPGLAADEARALQAAAAEHDTHLTEPDLASRAASLAARVADLVTAAEEAEAQAAAQAEAQAEAQAAAQAAAQAEAEQALGAPLAEDQPIDSSDLPTTDLTARAERVRRAAARFAANSARGKAGALRPENDIGSTSRGNRTF